MDVLGLLGQGKTSRQIAELLDLTIFTVNDHRKHICKKRNLHSTAQLVAFAVTHVAESAVPSTMAGGGTAPGTGCPRSGH